MLSFRNRGPVLGMGIRGRKLWGAHQVRISPQDFLHFVRVIENLSERLAKLYLVVNQRAQRQQRRRAGQSVRETYRALFDYLGYPPQRG